MESLMTRLKMEGSIKKGLKRQFQFKTDHQWLNFTSGHQWLYSYVLIINTLYPQLLFDGHLQFKTFWLAEWS